CGRVEARPGELGGVGEAGRAVEVMQMESFVGAQVAGRVLDVHIRPGEQVAPGQVLAVIGAG
ncbi:biotin/lipoyl-containing protein, partial [Clavibacter michiganensis]|uniref:biotin/lipoyl-containing protein n=1 Tax=Clavibacter michiganensis TaxID=28447 RepID=UPI00292E4CB4